MTESQEGTNTPYTEEEAYLYETYVTDDGIEVPPPTKVMGPRRLARYREEAAEYIRAMGRGKLPEPVDHMGPVVNNLVVDPRVLSIQRRFAALAAQGAIDTKTNDEDKLSESAPLTSSLNVVKQDQTKSKDPSDVSALNIPLTSSFTEPAPETSSLPMHDYLVRDEPKVEADSADAVETAGAAELAEATEEAAASTESVVEGAIEAPGTVTGVRNTQQDSDPVVADDATVVVEQVTDEKNAARAEVKIAEPAGEDSTVSAAALATDDDEAEQPAPISAVEAQGLDLSVLDEKEKTPADSVVAQNPSKNSEGTIEFISEDVRATAEKTKAADEPVFKSAAEMTNFSGDSAADDPTVALDPDKVGELVRRIVEHNQEPAEGEQGANSTAFTGSATGYAAGEETVAHEVVDYDSEEEKYELQAAAAEKKRRGSLTLTLVLLIACIAIILIGLFIVLTSQK